MSLIALRKARVTQKENILRKSRFHFGLVSALILAFPISITESENLFAEGTSTEAATHSQADTLMRLDAQTWIARSPFMEILNIHDRYRSEFARWRVLVAEYASEFAELIRSFPHGGLINQDSLFQIFLGDNRSAANASELFQPWANRWSGMWSNGVPQYHIWGDMYLIKGKWVQPVSLSETGFIELQSIDASLRQRCADMAINVFSPTDGISGWVSKFQKGRLELPHIGYPVNDTTLVWICQIKKPDELFRRNNRWFVFLETVVADNSGQTEYRIHGKQIMLESKLSVINERVAHFATYMASRPQDRNLINEAGANGDLSTNGIGH